ncbi:hypothetical protein RJT34_01043 [Clitoria ternatea]|uniref:Uncharacterized protein n=1 Tax=Clitoria ternatea TaxID=43366 RepID=A0AAN9KJ10_CLITE
MTQVCIGMEHYGFTRKVFDPCFRLDGMQKAQSCFQLQQNIHIIIAIAYRLDSCSFPLALSLLFLLFSLSPLLVAVALQRETKKGFSIFSSLPIGDHRKGIIVISVFFSPMVTSTHLHTNNNDTPFISGGGHARFSVMAAAATSSPAVLFTALAGLALVAVIFYSARR